MCAAAAVAAPPPPESSWPAAAAPPPAAAPACGAAALARGPPRQAAPPPRTKVYTLFQRPVRVCDGDPALSNTGWRTWAGAWLAARHLEGELACGAAGAGALRFLDLSCGTGLAGLSLALAGHEAVLCDLDVNVPTIRANLVLNGLDQPTAVDGDGGSRAPPAGEDSCVACCGRGGSAHVVSYAWGAPLPEEMRRPFDVVLCGDLLYHVWNGRLQCEFLATLQDIHRRRVEGAECELLFAFQVRSGRQEQRVLEEVARRLGLVQEELEVPASEPGAPLVEHARYRVARLRGPRGGEQPGDCVAAAPRAPRAEAEKKSVGGGSGHLRCARAPRLLSHSAQLPEDLLRPGERREPTEPAKQAGSCREGEAVGAAPGDGRARRAAKATSATPSSSRAASAKRRPVASAASGTTAAALAAVADLETPEKEAHPEAPRRRLAGKRPLPAAEAPLGDGSLELALAPKRTAGPAAVAPGPAPARPDHRSCAMAAGMGKRSILQKIRASEFQSSTKIEALVDEIGKMMDSDRANKAIVFSQFGAMLELVEFRLKRAGIACVVLRGGMSIQARVDSITAFNTDPHLRVILISLKAGGEGLNLQVANHVFLLDPWWNPACELQAIQRAHRIGQTREVRAVRFITTGTVEEKIIALQEKKQLVFDGAIDNSAAAISKLTEQDLRFLFQH
ncbi:unnamed protein product [Prorocentrum cordatum]|uniref:Helicase C-terminal domain-containing protein n=1 Tax=Prorocentrum cordatum TaxID=2364126 RepID=A0ABN9Q486_9DINO|nr:unnamed protein product [Polarella glacialis]